ncbi:MAG: hypothetical protein ACKPKO_52900, partial [Candidatus Fonsibacter sp.]
MIQDPPTSIESFLDPSAKLVNDPPPSGGACTSDLGALGATCDDDMPKLRSLMPSDENFVPFPGRSIFTKGNAGTFTLDSGALDASDRAKSGILCIGIGSVVGQAVNQSLSKDPGLSVGQPLAGTFASV